jgi:hypothetical protein
VRIVLPRRPSFAQNSGGYVNRFKISMARIEVTVPGLKHGQVRITFQVERPNIFFQVPIVVNMSDFDDTEMVQAAHNVLHQTFRELASQSKEWILSAQEVQQLSKLSLRSKEAPAVE